MGISFLYIPFAPGISGRTKYHSWPMGIMAPERLCGVPADPIVYERIRDGIPLFM